MEQAACSHQFSLLPTPMKTEKHQEASATAILKGQTEKGQRALLKRSPDSRLDLRNVVVRQHNSSTKQGMGKRQENKVLQMAVARAEPQRASLSPHEGWRGKSELQ